MALSPEQRGNRKLGIGSSEIASIFSENPWQSAYDLWLIKTGKAEEFEGNEACDRGNYLEPGLMLFAEKELGHPIERNITFLDPNGGPLAANLDGLCRELSANVEGKSISGDIDPDEWGEPYTDQVPSRVILQCHVAMLCADLSISYVPVILPVYKRFELRMYEVPFNADLATAIRERSAWFWNEHVLKDIPPSDSVPSLEVIKRIRREPGTWADVPDELVDAWIVAKAAASEAKAEAELAQAAILAAMTPISADGARTAAGKILTYTETQRKAYSVDATAYRTLRLKGEKRK